MIDRFKLPALQSRRIISLSSCTIEWVGTQLTYVAVAARGHTQVHIVVFKHSDCKFKHLYSFNMCPELANPETPESNDKQKYSNFPSDVKLSMDFAFLSVTLASGEVKILKMPQVLSPMDPQPPAPVEAAPSTNAASSKDAKGKPTGVQSPMTLPPASAGTTEGKELEVVKPDLDKFHHQELKVEECLITSIPARHRKKFVDPFVYKEEKEVTEEVDPASSGRNIALNTGINDKPDYNPNQLLGNKKINDDKGGDAGCLYKIPNVMPTVFFVRASCIAKSSSIYPHPEMQQLAKGMK